VFRRGNGGGVEDGAEVTEREADAGAGSEAAVGELAVADAAVDAGAGDGEDLCGVVDVEHEQLVGEVVLDGAKGEGGVGSWLGVTGQEAAPVCRGCNW
jgi:hypothetical protein